MPGRLDSAVRTLLSTSKIAQLKLAVKFETLGLKLVDVPKNQTINGELYTGSAGTHKFALACENLTTSLRWEVPSAGLTIDNADKYFATNYFMADRFRRDTVTITQVYVVAGVVLPTGWVTIFTCDMDSADPNTGKIIVRLGAAEAVYGSQGPRRTTNEFGCQAEFMGPDCGFTFQQGVHAQKLAKCDKGVDTPNGCLEHFKPVTDPSNAVLTIVQPIPYGAFPGHPDSIFARVG